MTRLILLATLLAAFTVLSPPAANQDLGTPANAWAPTGSAHATAASTDEQGMATAPDALVAPDRVPAVRGADATHSRWNDQGGDPDHFAAATAQDVKATGDLQVRATESSGEEGWRIPPYVAKDVTAHDAPQAASDRSCTLVFQPPYEQPCYSWGSVVGLAHELHSCNNSSGGLGTFADGTAGGATAEAMQRITFLVDTPCTVTFDAEIIRIGGKNTMGISAFASTSKTWAINDWDHYYQEFVDPPLGWDYVVDMIITVASLVAPFGEVTTLQEAIEVIELVWDSYGLYSALSDLVAAGDAEVLHVTDEFYATAGYHTIYVGLRSAASNVPIFSAYAYAVSMGQVTSITVTGSGLRPRGACCHPDGSACVENVFEVECFAAGWAYAGDGVSCAQADCAHRCPDQCDRCWLDTIYEGDCPSEWNGAGDGCDCYCQFSDADCAPCICGNGVCQYGPPCFEERQTCPTDCWVLDGDLATRGVWLSSAANDWNGEAIVLEPVEGQTVYIHHQYDTMGSGILPLHLHGITLDEELIGGGWVLNRPWGYRVRNCVGWVVLPGSHAACGVADYTHVITEPDENNNASCLLFAALPDCECQHDFECDDGNPCTDDWCDGCECQHSNNSAPCDDGVFCNGADTCSGGGCSVHTGNPCAGGGECADNCSESADDCFDPAQTPCGDDGNPCTYDWCDGHGDCTHPFKPDGTACPEGRCSDGVCIPEPDINCEALEVYYFGAVAENTCSEEHTWEIVNTGWALLDGEGAGIALTGQDASQFEITRGGGYDCLPLAPGESCTVGVRFCPTSGGVDTKSATLRIDTNDPDESRCDIELTGKRVDFGDCSDGDVIIDPNDSDICDPNLSGPDVCVLKDDMNFRNLTVPSDVTLDTHGYTVKVCENLVNNGVITDNWSGGDGGAGGAGGKGDNPWGTTVPSGCGPRDASGSCDSDGVGGDGVAGGAPHVEGAGTGGQGGGGGGGGGGSWHRLTVTDADGGNGGYGGQGGKGGGYVKVYAYHFDNQGVIHADGQDGADGEDAPEGDSTYPGGPPGGYLHCGAEYYEFTYLFLPRDLSGGGGGGGGGGAGGEGGTVEYAFYEKVHEGEIHAEGGEGGQGGNGGSKGGDCVHQPIFAMVNYPCGDGEYCGCNGGAPNGGQGGQGGVNGDGEEGGVGIEGATPGELGSLGSGGVDGEVDQDDRAKCSTDADCDDGLYCNGVEHCVGEKCKDGITPDCDDGLDCTMDWCYEPDGCRHDPEPGYCVIDGLCYVAGTTNPVNDCEECNPALDTLAWSPRPAGAPCGDRGCRPCDYPDTCDGAGACQPNEIPDPGPLSPPALQSPPDGANCQGTTGTLDWPDVSEAAGYMVQLGTGSCGSGTEYPVIVSQYSYSGLQPNTTYYWRVKTRNMCGNYGGYSGCFLFTTDPGALAAPTLLSPANGATDQPTSGTLDWADVPDATGYRVHIGTSCGTGAEYDVVESEYAYSGLSLGTPYYWSVKTKNACGGYGSYSDCFSFATVAFLAMDMNGDGFRSIIGDVPPFVDCVYFSECDCPAPGCTPRGDCNHDGFLSIIGDVPCFVDCVYFGDCGSRAGPERGDRGDAGVPEVFAIGGAVYTDLYSPLSSGLEDVTIELIGPLPAVSETPAATNAAGLSGTVEGPPSGVATQLPVNVADIHAAGKVFATAKTGWMGLWQLESVPRGTYIVRAFMPRYVLRHVERGVPAQHNRVTVIVDADYEAANQSIQFLATQVGSGR